jgi:transposase-like protein
MVAAAIRTIFAQPKVDMVSDQLGVIAGMLGRQAPRVEAMLRDAAEDLLAFTSFPPGHWKKIWSTNRRPAGHRPHPDPHCPSFPAWCPC